MIKFNKGFVAVSASFLLGFGSLACAAGADEKVAQALEKSLPSLVSSQDYRSASATALKLASARSRLGETAAACAALAQSLEYYRKALVQETGVSEAAASSIDDDSDGMAQVRARFGCSKSSLAKANPA
jgi:hypothetical protein